MLNLTSKYKENSNKYLCFLFFVNLITLASCKENATEDLNLIEYKSNKGLYLLYISEWSASESSLDLRTSEAKQELPIIDQVSFKLFTDNAISVNLTIGVYDKQDIEKSNTSAHTVHKNLLEIMFNVGLLKDTSIPKIKPITRSGINGFYSEFKKAKQTTDEKYVQETFTKNIGENDVIIQLQASPKQYRKTSPYLDKIITSLKFKK